MSLAQSVALGLPLLLQHAAELDKCATTNFVRPAVPGLEATCKTVLRLSPNWGRGLQPQMFCSWSRAPPLEAMKLVQPQLLT